MSAGTICEQHPAIPSPLEICPRCGAIAHMVRFESGENLCYFCAAQVHGFGTNSAVWFFPCAGKGR